MASKKQKTMSEKVVIQRRDHEMASRIVGTIFIVVGTILVGLGVYSFVTYRGEPELDDALSVPVLRELSDVTNDKIVELSGTVDGVDKVRIFLNDALLETVKVKDEKFSYDWNIENEGIYTISVDGLDGFPKQKRSNMSDVVFLTVDWTAPTSNISLDYPQETSKGEITISGVIDLNTTLYLKRGTQSYSSVSDEGNLSVGIELLDEGKNVFLIMMEDEAGNEVTLDEKVRVTYSPSGSVNGDGTTDSEIPEAAGNLVDALNEVVNNRLMMIFGLIGLVALFTTSFIVVKKNGKIG